MKNLFIFLILGLLQLTASAQKVYTLEKMVGLAREHSPAALQAATIKENWYWRWRTYKSNYKPQLALNGTLPDYSRTINPVVQPDGTTAFQPVEISNAILNLGVSQSIAATGGEVFVNSQLQRFDDMEREFSSYGGSPAVIGLKQPLFSFNELKWDKRIEPLLYEESQKKWVEELEKISLTTTDYFFKLLEAQNDLDIAVNNKKNNDTIYKISEVKYELGKITKEELLQLKLAVLNAQKDASRARLLYETAMLELKSYVGIPSDESISVIAPATIPVIEVDEQKALAEGFKNRQEAVSFQRKLTEAERIVAKAKGDNGLNADLIATYGLSNRADNIPAIYQNAYNQQTIRIGFSIPLLDWGRSASRIKTAKANFKLVEYTVAQDKIIFEQSIQTQVKQFHSLKDQVTISGEAEKIAAERYEISVNRFMIGGMSITDLNIAQQEKDRAKRDYIQSLKSFWSAYYNLRAITLYDFENNFSLMEKNL